MKEQYRRMGASEEDIEKAGLNEQEAIAREGIHVFKANLPVLQLFMGCANQWQVVVTPRGQLIRTGLDWQQVETRARYLPECRALDEAETDRLWKDITIMQNAALECMAELRDE